MIRDWLSKRVRHLRPRIGWFGLLLAAAAASTPSVVASAATLRLPGDLIFWAGLLGLLLGYLFYRRADEPRPPRLTLVAHIGRWLAAITRLAILTLISAVFLLAAGRALPPTALVLQDFESATEQIARVLNPPPLISAIEPPVLPEPMPQPDYRTPIFLGTALDRLARELLAAPYAGDRGATLLLSMLATLCTWMGGLGLGIALVNRRSLMLWSLPLLFILLLLGGPGGGGGPQLVLSVFVVLLVVVLADFNQREAGWLRARIDYSSELGRDTVLWGGILAATALIVAWMVPLWPGNPIAEFFARWGAPSGIAALDRGITRPAAWNERPVGISVLPPVLLGVPLSEEAPERIALRVRLAAPLAPGPWPRYWRVRVLNIYNGRSWASNARVEPRSADPFGQIDTGEGFFQQIEDRRTDRRIVAALPNLFALDTSGEAERFTDGSLSAITSDAPPDVYRALSRPQELGIAPPQPPDLSSFLQLPASLPQRVADLARVITTNSRTDLQRAIALETYLRRLPYSYRVAPVPGNGDAVDQFLFSMGEGYCTYYASAMAMMARTLGIPARVAIGYSTGELQPDGSYIVREAHAHAWPELYLDGRWVPFEPTPVLPEPDRGAAPIVTGPIADAPPLPEATGPASMLPWLIALALGIGALLLSLRWFPRLRPLAPVDQTLEQLELFGRQRGVRWLPGATLREYAEALEHVAGHQHAALAALVTLIERERYSATGLNPGEQRRLSELWNTIRTSAEQNEAPRR